MRAQSADGRHAADATTIDADGRAERERVLRVIRAHEAELRALGVARLWLFGSLARGDARAASDVDVMIAIPPGREVDVVVEEDLVPSFRSAIARDLVETL